MGKKSHTPESDILDEKYKGANSAVAAAGEAYYAHYWMAFVGLIGGGLLTYFLHEPLGIGTKVASLRKVAERWSTNDDNHLLRLTGKTIHGVFGKGHDSIEELRGILETHLDDKPVVLKKYKKNLVYEEKGFGFWLADHTVGLIPGVRNFIKEESKGSERVSMAITTGGLLGAIGFFVAPWIYAAKGVVNARQGRDQFRRAQEEIKELREDVEFVEEKNAELRDEVREAKASSLTVSKDDTPVIKHVAATHPDPAPEDPQTLAKRKDHEERGDDHGDGHARHTHHTERHPSQAGKSHGAHVRERQAATDHEQAIA